MIYSFACEDCNSQFELQMTIKEKDTKRVVCSNCKSEKVKRLFTPPAILFKGPGFYSTDNGGKHE